MDLLVYTKSESFKSFMKGVVKDKIEFHNRLSSPSANSLQIHLLHVSSLDLACYSWLEQNASRESVIASVCSDKPDIMEMLKTVHSGAKAYCNSYMQPIHYQQMIRLISNGQSWFPPALLEQTFSLAHQAMAGNDHEALLKILTSREKEVAVAVSEGASNRQIAGQFDITERTVKAHLTNIFKKLEIKDRVALVLYLKRS